MSWLKIRQQSARIERWLFFPRADIKSVDNAEVLERRFFGRQGACEDTVRQLVAAIRNLWQYSIKTS